MSIIASQLKKNISNLNVKKVFVRINIKNAYIRIKLICVKCYNLQAPH